MSPLDTLVGESRVMVALRLRLEHLLQRIAGLRRLPPILIQGETGTGKTLLARLIHQASARSEGPFVDINCAAIPETMLESELFGYERFAFTDAKQAKAGLFQMAHGGVLFLDEIGLLPMGLQGKLLKAIDEGTVRRLGATRSESVNVAIIAATNEDLQAAMREKRFRADLHSRVAVLSMELPPLRARAGDIELLAERFLAGACAEYGIPPKTLGDDARAALRTYAWPENVRELRNVMERVALEIDTPGVSAEGLGLPAARVSVEDTGPGAAGGHPAERLLETLSRTNWNITQTALLLGLSRQTVRVRIQRYRLRRPTEAGEEGGRAFADRDDAGVVTDDVPAAFAPGSSTAMPEVRICTLGRFSVTVGNLSLRQDDWKEPSARQLLKLLVTSPEPARAKESFGLAWSRLDVHRDTVRSDLSMLRRALVETGGEAMSALFVDDGESLGLRQDAPVWVDADEFERLITEARSMPDPLPLLEDANRLYAGDYLPDDVNEDWSVARREELRQGWTELQFLLARLCARRGKLDEAEAAFRRLLAKDGADERAAQELVRLLLRRGRPAEARRVYEGLIRVLDELNIEPSPGSFKLEREFHSDRPEHLPSGTVTFLLTEVEGSIRNWEDDAERMRAALARHDELLVGEIRACNGTVIRKREEGDSLVAVFRRATDAVVAAWRIQRRLASEPWITAAPIRVRMALNTGDAMPQNRDYSGAVVTRCAWLRAASHGGQILLSPATYDVIHDTLPAGIHLVDLGEYRLRDFNHPTRIFQVAGEGIPVEFPPLRISDAWTTMLENGSGLPVTASALIGRERELTAGGDLLSRPGVRLLTLTGPPGTGKTRLSLQLASDLRDRFPDGTYFVALASVEGPDLVPWTIGRALGLQEGGSRPLPDLLKDYLRPRTLLLVLDNFEHVLPAAGFVATLLEMASGIKILVTSRAPLHLRAEHEFPVPPLALPEPHALSSVAGLAQCASVALYVERAAAVRPDFALTDANANAVAEICTRLDGLPLAIELAAARSKLLPPQAMLARLERRLSLLVGGAADLPARHRTLRQAIAWGHDLLDKTDQQLFRRLSVFVGGWTVSAAEKCCNARGDLGSEVLDGIASLLDKSFVRLDAGDAESRFGMLETIRDYGLDQLESSGEGPEMRDRHLDYCLALAEEADAGLLGTQQVIWCERLEAEHANICAAFAWVLASLERELPGTPGLTRAGTRLEAGIRLADALELFWMLRGHSRENWQRVMGLVARASEHTPARARILVVAGYMAHCLLDHDSAVRLADEGLATWRALGDAREIAVALTRRGVMAIWQGDHSGAEAWLTQARALFREHGGEQRSGIEHPIAAFLAQAVQEQGHHELAYTLYEEGLAEAEGRGDRHAAAYARRHLARLSLESGAIERAVAFLREGLLPLRDLRDRRCTPACLEALAYAVARRDQWADAARLFAAADAMRDVTGMPLMRTDRDRQEGERAALEGRLGRDAFAAAWADGRDMSLNQAIDYALEISLPGSAVSG